MFLDVNNRWFPPERWPPEPAKPKLTKRGERAIAWVIGFNLLMLLLGPLAGATVIEALIAMARG